MTIPTDVKPVWFNPIRRLQSIVAKSKGLAIVSVKFLVNEKGEPVNWTEPKLTLIEPMGQFQTPEERARRRQAFLDLLGD